MILTNKRTEAALHMERLARGHTVADPLCQAIRSLLTACVPLPYRNRRKLTLSPHSSQNSRFNQQACLSKAAGNQRRDHPQPCSRWNNKWAGPAHSEARPSQHHRFNPLSSPTCFPTHPPPSFFTPPERRRELSTLSSLKLVSTLFSAKKVERCSHFVDGDVEAYLR